MLIIKIGAVFLVFAAAILLQHMAHEYGHVAAARLYKVKILKIHWLTYSKMMPSSRVYYENEPDMRDDEIDKKWGCISIAGLMTTMATGYLLLGFYIGLGEKASPWVILFLWLFSVIFLMSDPIYLLLGSLFNFGDIVGFKRAFHISRMAAVLGSTFLLAVNCFLIISIW